MKQWSREQTMKGLKELVTDIDIMIKEIIGFVWDLISGQ